MSNRISMFVLAATLLLPVAVHAGSQDRERVWEAPVQSRVLDGSLVQVQVQVDGEMAPLFFSPRWQDDRRYFEAFAGRNYAIALRNNTGRRVAVLLAVDGLNVVNGARSSLSASEPMYVLDPYESTTIRGWRTSLDHVQRFVFVDERRSYAERSGQASADMGWIRVLTFREQRPWWDRSDRRDDGWGRLNTQEENASRGAERPMPALPPDAAGKPKAQDAPQAASPATPDGSSYAQRDAKSAPGTGWGDRRYDPVQRTSFTPDGPAVDHLILRYEYASGLLALGIDPHPERARVRVRERDSEYGFAQPPRW